MALLLPGPFEFLFLLILMGGIALTVLFFVKRRSVVQRGFVVNVAAKPKVLSQDQSHGTDVVEEK